ncbi:MAG: hypothetical protein MZU84_04165 [Sphingobacterium sp.]|nr:hypothetical protein [Sphingobacterium sp.]
MILVVTGIGFLIHVYSIGYMHDEPTAAYARYFAYLNLFVVLHARCSCSATTSS